MGVGGDLLCIQLAKRVPLAPGCLLAVSIAGVINFITKKNYEGGEVNVNYSHPQHAGGSADDADLNYGIGNLASDGYNFMITGNYTQQKQLTATQRPFSAAGYDAALGLANFNGPY
jgi:hypothetical protein